MLKFGGIKKVKYDGGPGQGSGVAMKGLVQKQEAYRVVRGAQSVEKGDQRKCCSFAPEGVN